MTANQFDWRPYWANCDAKVSPLMVTLCGASLQGHLQDTAAEVTEVVALGHPHRHQRADLGIGGSMADTGTCACQVWCGLHAPGTHTASPRSGTAAKVPPAV